MKELKDYLHLYLGCKIDFIDDDGENRVGTLVGIKYTTAIIKFEGYIFYRTEDLRLHLRPISSITDEEAREAGSDPSDVFEAANQVKYLLSKHFDLFGLIAAGLAIDATTFHSKQH